MKASRNRVPPLAPGSPAASITTHAQSHDEPAQIDAGIAVTGGETAEEGRRRVGARDDRHRQRIKELLRSRPRRSADGRSSSRRSPRVRAMLAPASRRNMKRPPKMAPLTSPFSQCAHVAAKQGGLPCKASSRRPVVRKTIAQRPACALAAAPTAKTIAAGPRRNHLLRQIGDHRRCRGEQVPRRQAHNGGVCHAPAGP